MMMKKILSGLILYSVLIAGCSKNHNAGSCPYTISTLGAPLTEIQALKDSLDSSSITATQDPSGFFYKIASPGSGTGITNLCSTVTVTYKGTYFDGRVLDSSTAGNPASFQLGQVIVGWQRGLPLVSKGGDITLYIPPTLGYGPDPITDTNGNVLIPGNSYLIFNIHIVDIQ